MTRNNDLRVEHVEYRGCTIDVYIDEATDGLSPLEWGNLGTMVCFHRRYNLGHIHPKCGFKEWLRDLVSSEMPDNFEELNEADQEKAALDIWNRDYIFLPLFLMDHSGLSLSTSSFSCPWDSGQLGFIYVSRKNAEKEFGGGVNSENLSVEQRAVKVLEDEAEIYGNFISGEVYRYEIKNWDGDDVDSCCGFIGMDEIKDYIIPEAKKTVDIYIEKTASKELAQAGEH